MQNIVAAANSIIATENAKTSQPTYVPSIIKPSIINPLAGRKAPPFDESNLSLSAATDDSVQATVNQYLGKYVKNASVSTSLTNLYKTVVKSCENNPDKLPDVKSAFNALVVVIGMSKTLVADPAITNASSVLLSYVHSASDSGVEAIVQLQIEELLNNIRIFYFPAVQGNIVVNPLVDRSKNPFISNLYNGLSGEPSHLCTESVCLTSNEVNTLAQLANYLGPPGSANFNRFVKQ